MPSDFITTFMTYSEDFASPRLFKLWCAISLVGASLERRVSVRTKQGSIYPNLFTMLIAPPGVGKFIITRAKELMSRVTEPGSQSRAFHLSSDSVTSASLVDELASAKTIKILGSGPPMVYNSMFIVQEEFQVLMPGYDLGFIARLNKIWNNPNDGFTESRRTGTVKELKIALPQFNMLAGAQPSYFASTFPEEAWSTGFARRIMMIYSVERQADSLWGEPADTEALELEIIAKLQRNANLIGQMSWTADAAGAIDEWQLGGEPGMGGQPIPRHSKLSPYCRSRTVTAIKLSMISAVSRTGKLTIEACDVRRALEWMFEAESGMPDIFREMLGKSDLQVIEETHLFVSSLYARNRPDAKGKRAPVPGSKIREFLLARVPHDKAESLLNAMDKANILVRTAGTDDWVPRPKHEHTIGEE